MADIRNPTCSKHEFLPPICFSKDQGFPGHSAFCLTTVDILCTRLKSPTFFSALPCRICRFKLTWSSRCNKTTSVCLFLFNGCFMEWPNVLSLRWHVICDVFFCIILILREKMWRHHNMFHIFYLVHTKGDVQKVVRECTPTDHMQCIGMIFICWIYHETSAPGHT